MVGRQGGEPPPENWARRNGGWVAIGALLIGFWMAVLGPGNMPPRTVVAVGTTAAPPRVMTQGDIARWGNDAAMEHLRTLDGGRAVRVVERARIAVVRFEVTAVSTERPGTIRQWGSGVLVNGGRHVLVSGHVLDMQGEPSDLKYSVVLTDGRILGGRVPAVRGGVGGAPDGDWGLVELEGPPPKDCPSLALGAVADDATVVLLGYSGGWGLHAGGKVRPVDRSKGGSTLPPLRPLAFVGTLDNAESGRGEIVAGVLPEGGASGGAVIDLEGRLVGVMAIAYYTGMLITPPPDDEDPSNPGFHESIGFRVTPVGAFRGYLEERWKR